jgi:hypothetical protein
MGNKARVFIHIHSWIKYIYIYGKYTSGESIIQFTLNEDKVFKIIFAYAGSIFVPGS